MHFWLWICYLQLQVLLTNQIIFVYLAGMRNSLCFASLRKPRLCRQASYYYCSISQREKCSLQSETPRKTFWAQQEWCVSKLRWFFHKPAYYQCILWKMFYKSKHKGLQTYSGETFLSLEPAVWVGSKNPLLRYILIPLCNYSENFMALGPKLWEEFDDKDQKVPVKYT